MPGSGRAFRAIVYDKGAVALHMLRQLVGERAFWSGLRRFYRTWRFRKAGTGDLRQALEAESGMSLKRFFDRWIDGDTLPRLAFTWRTTRKADGEDLDLRFEQVGEVFDLPMTVTIRYADGSQVDLIVPITDRLVERRVALTGRVRDVLVNRDDIAPVRLSR